MRTRYARSYGASARSWVRETRSVRPRTPLAVLSLATLLLSACAGLPPAPMDGRPFELEPDERALWAQAEREAEALRQRARAYDDPLLPPYLLALAGVPAPAGAAAPVLRVQVVRDPMLNAFALPDGLLLVHTGLLAAVERPAELGLLLAREVAHVTHRHALALDRAGRTRPPLPVAMGPTGPVAAAILGEQLALAGTAAIAGYPEGSEREADRIALERIRLVGVAPGAAGEIFTQLARRARQQEGEKIFLLTQPAWLEERQRSVARLRTGLPAVPAAGVAAPDQADFETRLRPVVRENAVEEIRRGRFAEARVALERVLAAAPRDAVAHVYYGDLHRLQAQQEGSPAARLAQIERAREHYTRAMGLDPMLAMPHRQLGLLHYELGDRVGARADFERYLALAPGAPDAARIAEYVRELSR